ncbi:MAG: hypothetical protein D6679_14310 [Candidatus Hydrogenedentota bacterium]|nr:MAG: hypothetical protein D6679_14310 [Candidatus Hydrogenedentota bacterium]
MERLSFLAAALLYLFSTILFHRFRTTGRTDTDAFDETLSPMRESGRSPREATTLLGLGLLLQFGILFIETHAKHSPFLTARGSLNGLIIAWTILGLIFLRRLNAVLLGEYIAFFAAVILGLAALLPASFVTTPPRIHSTLQKVLLAIHAAAGFAGYASFLTAGLAATLLYLQNRALLEHRLDSFTDSLPPVKRSEKILVRGLVAGILLLPFAVAIAAFGLLDTIPVQTLHHDPNIETAVGIWVFACIVATAGFRSGWTRRPVLLLGMALSPLLIFLRLLFAFLGRGVHSFGGI